MSFGVIGAGVIGLTTALELQKEFPNANVTILADKFNLDTTSDVAAGLFRPASSWTGPNEELTRRWINDSYNYWASICQTRDAPLAGVTEMSAYIFSSTSPDIVRNHYLEKLLPIYRTVTDERELKLCPGNWKYGSFFTTTLTECRIYQPWATKKFEMAGGKMIKKSIKSLTDNCLNSYDVIINCTGLGAKELCNDKKLVPIRGQIIKVKAPWIKTAFYGDYDTYIIPGFNGLVTLGGTRQYDSYNLNIDKYDSLSIRERCEKLLPSLVGASVNREGVGLRPHRDCVRVETELILNKTNENIFKIVHNYGHGGFGVSTAPGTSKYAVKLVKELLSSSSSLNSNNGCASKL